MLKKVAGLVDYLDNFNLLLIVSSNISNQTVILSH